MMITMQIKGTPSYSAAEFNEYIYNRNKAFQTFDYEKIKKVQERYGVKTQPNDAEFWAYVARTVLEMDCARESARREAIRVLDELNAQ